AEISNDTRDYKTLMILGNRSAGIGRRVSVWDRLEVNGTFAVTGAAAVGGAATVAGTLTVSGAITPAAGNAETAGIMFPRDPGGGSGDAAWMRYYARSGEACTLELGTANDPDDHIALMPSGNVGIGVNAPRERLEVAGAIRVGSGGNPLQIGGAGHTGFVNLELANAEISNDTRDYKTLMILGNRSAGIGRRVSVWDRLEVNGTLAVTGDVSLAGGLVAPGAPEGTRVLRGSVKANGDLEGGVGFTVKRVGTGMYDITFATAFTARPSGVATQVYPNFDDFGTGGDTRDNAVIVGLNASRMRIKTGGGDGGASDRCFCFVVFGPR
ncbi:MAG TPA: hypothetical protein VFY65_14220, partial [Longimicrobium sp.]|nr:hypothetical protein [Longimicrobium sp.]